mmetsp:Transcript_127643/g.369541  ORF Transcript_127643/g.369541 Transcript_127643/m.369541 type:complete len:244 (-) Transcript_127643:1147-1878(-)
MAQYMDAHIHGKPMPRKMFTELLPVTFTIEASAYSSCFAAVRDAKRSGTEVPKATMEMAVMASGMPSAQPKSSARSPMMTVRMPMPIREKTKQTHPPRKMGGGVPIAKGTFQGTQMACTIQSWIDAASCSSRLPLQYKDSRICSFHCVVPNRISSMFTIPSKKVYTLSLIVRGRGFSLMRCTVNMFFSAPPSRLGLKLTVPVSSSMTIWNLSCFSPCDFGRIVNSISCSITLSRNINSFSSST